jgi:signal transduction histidine kinase/CheY-like chemotaxis protein
MEKSVIDTNGQNLFSPSSINEPHFNKSDQDVSNHKSLLERAEFIGRLGFWEYDVKNGLLWASQGAKAIYGFKDCDTTLKDIKKIVFPEYRPLLDRMFDRLISHNDKYEAEFKIYRNLDGEIVDIRSQAEYDIREMKIYGIIQDISHQIKTEKELISARQKAEESDRLKSAFVSNMSHEIRTPMNGIVGFAHLLTESDNDIEARNEYKEHIHLCCNQLLDKVNAILDIAQIEAGQVVINQVDVNINKLLKEISESYISQARQKNIQVRINPDRSVNEQILSTDRVKLTKILSNLTDNAVRFTNTGFIELGYRKMDAETEFYVKDTGIGISESNHEIIFQPFTHAESNIPLEYGGTGLGLSIAKTYIELLGGRIWLESQSGNGSTFFFTLPGSVHPVKKEEIIDYSKKSAKVKTSLIVEDMEMNYIYLKTLLEELGINILWAKDGNQAVEMVLKNREIDLVLMDIRLPYTDGYEATKIIKKIRPDLPVIAQTANALQEERKKALEAGCDGYITKPIYKNEFRKTLSTFIDF